MKLPPNKCQIRAKQRISPKIHAVNKSQEKAIHRIVKMNCWWGHDYNLTQ
jgi:hypothetical protein